MNREMNRKWSLHKYGKLKIESARHKREGIKSGVGSTMGKPSPSPVFISLDSSFFAIL